MEKTLQTRIINKHDTEANWKLQTNFIPFIGEVIVYDKDTNYSYERMKIGDGATTINALPFVNDYITQEQINAICGVNIYFANEEVL